MYDCCVVIGRYTVYRMMMMMMMMMMIAIDTMMMSRLQYESSWSIYRYATASGVRRFGRFESVFDGVFSKPHREARRDASR